MSQYFPPYRSSVRNIKVELDLSSYATITDLKNVTHVDVNKFALKTNLANLKTEVAKIDIAKFYLGQTIIYLLIVQKFINLKQKILRL